MAQSHGIEGGRYSSKQGTPQRGEAAKPNGGKKKGGQRTQKKGGVVNKTGGIKPQRGKQEWA